MDYRKQAFYNTIGNIVYLFSLWLLSIVITRISGYRMVGIFNLAMTVVNIFYSIQMFGMRSYQVSDVSARYKSEHYLFSRIISVCIGIILGIIYIFLMNYSFETNLAILLFLGYKSCEAVSDCFFGELQKCGKLQLSAISLSVKGTLSVIVFAVVLSYTNNINVSLFSIFLLAVSITIFYDFRNFKTNCLFNIESTKFKEGIYPLYTCFSLMLATLIPIVVTSLPRIILENEYGEELLGYYGNISAPTVLIIAVVPTVLTPFMTLYGTLFEQRNFKKLLINLVFSMIGVILFGIICLITVFFVGKPVMAFVFGNEIIPYVKYLYPLIISMVIYALTMCCNSILISTKRNRVVLWSSIVSIIFCSVFSYQLVSVNGILGVIYSMVLSYVGQLCFQIIYIFRMFVKEIYC